jgi:hypothetical protein
MFSAATSPTLRRLALLLAWRRVRFTLIASVLWGLLLSAGWKSPISGLLGRTIMIGLILMLVFGLFEKWPAHLPRWLARWVLQVVCVAIAVPLAVLAIYLASTGADQPSFYLDKDRMDGFSMLTGTGLLFSPWIAMSALMRQRDSIVLSQAAAFERERGDMERKALDALLRLLQAQVEPHFLFNTRIGVSNHPSRPSRIA